APAVHQLELRRACARIAEAVHEVVPVRSAGRRKLEKYIRCHADAGRDLRLGRAIVGYATAAGEGGEVRENNSELALGVQDLRAVRVDGRGLVGPIQLDHDLLRLALGRLSPFRCVAVVHPGADSMARPTRAMSASW